MAEATPGTVDLLHIGLGKCMSTSLQNMWRASTNCNFIETLSFTRDVNELLWGGGVPGWEDLIDLEVSASPNGLPNIISNEEFTFSFISMPQFAPLLPKKHAVLAKVFAPKTKNVLMIVRDPIKWMKSAHAQSIHQGLSGDFKTFYARTRNLIMQMLDLRTALSHWKDFKGNLIILPMEMYVEEPERFWQIYEEKTGLERPNVQEPPQAGRNQSDAEKIQIQSRLNAIMTQLIRMGEKSMAIPNPNELASNDQAMKGLLVARLHGVYLAMKNAEVEDLDVLGQLMGHATDETFTQAQQDLEMRSHLKNNYIDELTNNKACEKYLNQYAKSLANLV